MGIPETYRSHRGRMDNESTVCSLSGIGNDPGGDYDEAYETMTNKRTKK